jgi:methionine biosynthesis protein MetW
MLLVRMASGGTRYRDIVARHGLSGTHRQVIDWTPTGSRVLEVGCASGYVGSVLSREKACTVTGIEIDATAAAEARQAGLTVVEGSLEEAATWNMLTGRFDVIVAADVLEHLREPERVLARFKQLLAPGGMAIVAVPNVAVWSMRKQLFFRGDFRYQDEGLLDRTHLRFFTWETLHDLVRSQGWSIDDTMVEGWQLPVGRRFLERYPAEIRRGVSKLSLPGSVGQRIQGGLMTGSEGLVSAGEAVMSWAHHRWPNLCAAHIALKLRDAQ